MPILTTSKLIAVLEQFASDARQYKLLGLLDKIEANDTARNAYEASCASSGYDAVQKANIQSLETALKGRGGVGGREVDTLMAGAISLQMNSAYYLLKGFTSSVSNAQFHIRFENPGEKEISDFHLTTEENWGQVNLGGGLWAKNHFFFKINAGVIEPMTVNRIVGQGLDQASDMRLGTMVQDVLIYVYYIMYCLRSI
jgi:hypothetical protein